MKNLLAGLILFFAISLQAQLKSPSQFLPNYGKQVSYYHQLEAYFQHLVENSQYIQYHRYGQTTQERNLNAYYISTPENLADLENIRQNHLYHIGLGANNPASANDKAIVWLSFNVHGNEMGAAESL